MALIVEDGTQVAGANTYATAAAHIAYALLRGVVLDPTKVEQYNANAIDWIENKRNELNGQKVTSTQALQFPRSNLNFDGFDFPSNSIPSLVVKLNSHLIMEQSLGTVLMPTQTEPAVKSETVGPIKTEYAVNAGSLFTPYISAIDEMIKPLLKTGSGAFGLKIVRV